MTTHPSFTLFTLQSKAFKFATVFFLNLLIEERLDGSLEQLHRNCQTALEGGFAVRQEVR